ncbi:protein ALP1-like [Salvia divinorum]|uniref:Protein ALP1-like n=1 Tax=Salvia divinorum TaxID=28513 RepID=A0ABD1HTV4_SALDI
MDPNELNRLIQEAEQEEHEYYQQYYANQAADVAAANPPQRIRRYFHRDREGADVRLVRDYFCDEPRFPADYFRRRFRMRKDLFLRIVNALAARDEFFQERPDATGRQGFTTLQKCTCAIRQLATGQTSDMFDEYLHVGESTGRECLKRFCVGLRKAFGEEYLRQPNTEDCQQLLLLHEGRHGFPGMLGSIDCMHWKWKNCPTAWRGQYVSGHKGTHPTLILEAVADYRLWIWHAYFGAAGSNNDLNVLNSSHLFNDVLKGKAPAINFTANGRQYRMRYYLADGIYPKWPTFVKTLNMPQDPKWILFAQRQEAAQKDVERAFGVLQARFNVVKAPARMWYVNNLADIMFACIIMHNMIIEDEGPNAADWFDEDNPGSSTSSSPPRQGAPPSMRERIEMRTSMRDTNAHVQLQEDLIEHIWAKFG